MKCDNCEEVILYEVTELFEYVFCDDECLDQFINENKIVRDIDNEYK